MPFYSKACFESKAIVSTHKNPRLWNHFPIFSTIALIVYSPAPHYQSFPFIPVTVVLPVGADKYLR